MSLRICAIGCGNHASQVHGPSYRKYAAETPDTVLAACCDLDEKKAAKFQREFGFARYYTDMDQMLRWERPDAVCVVVPEYLIASTAANVMKKGFRVLMEKPPGLNKEECAGLIAAGDEAGVIGQVAFNRRQMPLMQALKTQMDALEPGTIQSIFYEFYRFNRRESSFETTAIHGIDAVKMLAGSDYREVRFTYQELPGLGERVCNIYLDCVFENGIVARLNFCPCSGVIIDRVCVNANGHSLFLETPIWDGFDAPGRLIHIQNGVLISSLSGLEAGSGQEMFETNGFYDEDRLFFEDVRHNRPGRNDIRSALQSVEIAECIKDRAVSYKKQDAALDDGRL